MASTQLAPAPALTAPRGRAAGRAARAVVPRSTLAEWRPGAGRRDPLEVLADQDAARVPDLIPVRYGRMLASPFTFFRGAAAIMANDLGSQQDTGLVTQLCGDAHLSNFGAFAAPDRRLVFDVNDFDETLPGPFEWDVKRLATSFEIAGRDRGLDERRRRRCVLAVGREYRLAMRRLAKLGELAVWYSRLEIDDIARMLRSQATREDRRRFERNLAKARNKDSLRALAKLAEKTPDGLRIADRPPVLVPISKLAGDLGRDEIAEMMAELLGRYRETLQPHCRTLLDRFRFVDAGHKVVGVGSVGTRAWIALMTGKENDEPLFLQVKQAAPSVLEPFVEPQRFEDHGRRVVVGQRLMQASSDIFLGWLHGVGFDRVERHFYVRQLWDGKASAEIELMSPGALEGYARLCGRTLARTHARGGDRTAIAAYLGKGEAFERALVDFAAAYADQNEADYRRMRAAEDDGAIAVQRGV